MVQHRTGAVSMSALLSRVYRFTHDGDIYRVTHRSGAYQDVEAVSINDARKWAAEYKGWRQLDMHVRIVEVNGAAPERRNNRLLAWLTGALPFNLWR